MGANFLQMVKSMPEIKGWFDDPSLNPANKLDRTNLGIRAWLNENIGTQSRFEKTGGISDKRRNVEFVLKPLKKALSE